MVRKKAPSRSASPDAPARKKRAPKQSRKRELETWLRDDGERLLSVNEAAAYLSCSSWLVRQMIKDNGLPAFDLAGKLTRIRLNDLREFIEKSRNAP